MLKKLFSRSGLDGLSKTMTRTQTVNEIIEEIHESFYTEVDKLLAGAKIFNSLETQKQQLLDKARRLKAVGFTDTPEVHEAQKEIDRINKLKSDNVFKEKLVEAINYFSFKYPNYKFITFQSVEKICEKYGLILGSVKQYIGHVPDKNLKHIEDFVIKSEDRCFEEVTSSSYNLPPRKRIVGFDTYREKYQRPSLDEISRETWLISVTGETRSCNQAPLEIVAPRKDFKLKRNQEIVGYKIQDIPDPVVLHPVFFKGSQYYLVVTAWGLEGEDELVVNQKMN